MPAGIPVIVATIEDAEARALQMGASACLVKPFDRNALAALAARLTQGANRSAA